MRRAVLRRPDSGPGRADEPRDSESHAPTASKIMLQTSGLRRTSIVFERMRNTATSSPRAEPGEAGARPKDLAVLPVLEAPLRERRALDRDGK